MDIPWNVIDKILSGERLSEHETRFIYGRKAMYKLHEAIGLEGSFISTSSIVLTDIAKNKITTLEQQNICKCLRKLARALELLKSSYQDAAAVWELAVMQGENYIDVAIMLGMSTKSKDTMRTRVFAKIKKAAFLLAGYLE